MNAVQYDLFESNDEESVNYKAIMQLQVELGNVRRGTFKRISDLQARCLYLEERLEKVEMRLNRVDSVRGRKNNSNPALL